jgi:hypothetical protein
LSEKGHKVKISDVTKETLNMDRELDKLLWITIKRKKLSFKPITSIKKVATTSIFLHFRAMWLNFRFTFFISQIGCFLNDDDFFNTLHTLARLKIDSTPIEGLDIDLVNQEFKKELSGYQCEVALAIVK